MADDKAKDGDSGGQQDAGAVKKKISIVKILILLIIALVVFGGAAVGVLYFLYGMESADTDSGSKTQAGEPKEGDSPQTPVASEEVGTHEFKPFIVNLADNGSYLKVTIALGYGAVEQQKLLEGKSTQIRDAILAILSSKSSKTLSTKHGKMKLKEDIKKALNKLAGLGNVVTSVYFTEFQIL